jgi:hypothetical protein
MRGEPSSAGLAFDHFTVLLERLILCEFAIANLTTANANVFYELGVRHSVQSTAPTFGAASKVKQLMAWSCACGVSGQRSLRKRRTGRGLEVVDTPRASEDFPHVTLARGG